MAEEQWTDGAGRLKGAGTIVVGMWFLGVSTFVDVDVEGEFRLDVGAFVYIPGQFKCAKEVLRSNLYKMGWYKEI